MSSLRKPRRVSLPCSEALENRLLLAAVRPEHSNATATHTLFIDFDGAAAFDWSGNSGVQRAHGAGGNNVPIPAFSTDADTTTFKDPVELDAMDAIWSYVAEKYSPFNLDVTTVDPGTYADNKTVRVIVGGNNSDWYGSGGGVAAISGFASASLDNTAFVWSADAVAVNPGTTSPTGTTLSSYALHYIGESIAHEAGHEFGLVHERYIDSSNVTQEYYPGNGSIAPIMGGSSNAFSSIGRWWRTGNYGQNSLDAVEDELSILQGAISLRADDIPTERSLVIDPNTGSVADAGIISAANETDGFRFTAAGSAMSITVNNAARGGMLSPDLTLQNIDGSPGPTFSVTRTPTSATLISSALGAGIGYRVVVGGVGLSYGNIGQYTLSGTIGNFATLSGGYLTINGEPGSTNLVQFTYTQSSNIYSIIDSIYANGVGFPRTVQKDYTASAILGVIINLQDRADTLTIVDGLAPKPVTVHGGGGDDSLIVQGTSGNDVYSLTSVLFNGANVQFDGFEHLSIEALTGNDAVFVRNVPVGLSVSVHGGDGNDSLTVGGDDLFTVKSRVTFYGDNNTDTLIVDGTATEATYFALTGAGVDYSSLVTAGAQGAISYLQTENLSVNGGARNDGFFAIGTVAGTTITVNGGAGNDAMTIGDVASGAGLEGVLTPLTFVGGAGDDLLHLDDAAATANRTYTIASNSIKNQVSAAVTWSAEHITLDGVANHYGTYNLAGTTTSASLTLNGGNLADQFFINSNAQVNVTLNGGAGSDGLTVDDRNSSGVYKMILSSASIIRQFGVALNPFTIGLNGIDLPSYYAGPNTHTLNVLGTPASAFGYFFVLYGSAGADAFTLKPHDPLSGVTTFLSRLDIAAGGGADTVSVDDSESPVAVAYTFRGADDQSFAPYLDSADVPRIFIEADVENITLIGSAYDDAYDFKSSTVSQLVSVIGGDGADSVTAGGDDLAGNFPRLGPFLFDGQGGVDSFTLANSAATANWTYTRDQTFILASKSNFIIGFHENAEKVSILSGSGNDTFLIHSDGPDGPMWKGDAGRSMVNGFEDNFDGGAGSDYFQIGNAGVTTGINAQLNILDSQLAEANYVVIDDSADQDPVTLHVAGNVVGSASADTLFGPGGSLSQAGGVYYMRIFTGFGVATAFVRPSETEAIDVITRGNAGDSVGLALAEATNPVVTDNGDGSTTYSADTFANVTVSGFETQAVDDLSPEVDSTTYDYDAATPSVRVHFSEDVSDSIRVGLFKIVDRDTGEELSDGNLDVSYDADSMNALIRYVGGSTPAFPKGNYRITMEAEAVADLFGNLNETPLSSDFFSLPGDANHNGIVNFTDLLVLAQNFGHGGRTFSQGNFNYSSDGLVNFSDLLLLAQNFGLSAFATASLTSARFDTTLPLTSLDKAKERWIVSSVLST